MKKPAGETSTRKVTNLSTNRSKIMKTIVVRRYSKKQASIQIHIRTCQERVRFSYYFPARIRNNYHLFHGRLIPKRLFAARDCQVHVKAPNVGRGAPFHFSPLCRHYLILIPAPSVPESDRTVSLPNCCIGIYCRRWRIVKIQYRLKTGSTNFFLVP